VYLSHNSAFEGRQGSENTFMTMDEINLN